MSILINEDMLIFHNVCGSFIIFCATLPTANFANTISILKDSELTVSLSTRCVICMMDFEYGDPIRFLPCLHIYHVDCIDPWLMRSFTCPSCMEPVDAALLSSYETNWAAPWRLLLPKSNCTFLAETVLAVQTGSQGDEALCRCLEVVLGCRQVLKTVPYSTLLKSDMHLFGVWKLICLLK